MKAKFEKGSAWEITSIAYLIAVLASGGYLFAVTLGRVVIDRIHSHTFYPLTSTIIILLTDFIAVPFVLIGSLIFSFIPSAILLGAAVRYRCNRPLVYVLLGALISLVAGLSFFEVARHISWYADDPQFEKDGTFHHLTILFMFVVPAGMIGGLVFWIRSKTLLAKR